jgi:ubiquinone/menaquinone biosynthesis C-methylase UbiE
MSAFDLVAPEFERHRALPKAALQGIREAVRAALLPASGALLDLGAGSGRLGRAFVDASDPYVGLDRSLAMLERFPSAPGPSGARPRLVQADGASLPFPHASFAGVLLAHVLSAAPGWRGLLAEARRVLKADGALLLADRVTPPDGLDARLRAQLRTILAGLRVEMPEAGKAKSEARAWLAGVALSHRHRVAASWRVECTPRDFLERHANGVRLVALPHDVRQESMRRLSAWAAASLGGLDQGFAEERRFELDAFRFAPGALPRGDEARG